jgi:hypothetical protein
MDVERRQERRHRLRRMSDIEVDHEVRLQDIEIWRERTRGALNALGFVLGGAVTVAGIITPLILTR